MGLWFFRSDIKTAAGLVAQFGILISGAEAEWTQVGIQLGLHGLFEASLGN